ncbi:hypothetical protein PRIPAC_78584 [Pristionchus pacificus]|uniref:Uncharacterized protein n=1 Tax=Pristionchus pacificus TaxID=54126 RepID=A0A2A6CKI9_PRIPA|nr:hypothetical protein PRIPAC_78584 [Pristionchus pacificus]|eukprot:PDM78620.1 hypothetical protein PRIPAC_31199 [Pristionchus pacificus]
MVDGMERQHGEINMLEFFQEYTQDVICKVALGMHDIQMFQNPYLDVCRDVFYRPLRSPDDRHSYAVPIPCRSIACEYPTGG